jgi:hypothetical protein
MLQAGRSRVRVPMRWSISSFQPHLALGSTRPLTEMSTRNLPGSKGRPARKADNLPAICEPIIYILWGTQRLSTLWASMAWYRDSFTFFTQYHRAHGPVTVAERSKTCTVFVRSKAGIVGSNPTQGKDV